MVKTVGLLVTCLGLHYPADRCIRERFCLLPSPFFLLLSPICDPKGLFRGEPEKSNLPCSDNEFPQLMSGNLLDSCPPMYSGGMCFVFFLFSPSVASGMATAEMGR